MEFLTVPFSLIQGTTDPFVELGDLPENSFRGLATMFGGLIDSYCPTIIQQGAFTKTLQEKGRGVKILWQHDATEPIGLPTYLAENQVGLVLQAKISDTNRGRDCMQLMRDGVIDALSIGFDPIKEEYVKDQFDNVTRHIKEVRLWEVSAVTWGADPNAHVMQVHSTGVKMLQGKIETSAATPFGDLPLLDRSVAWDSTAAVNSVRDWSNSTDAPNAKYRRAFLWYDSAAADQYGSYKLPIATVSNGTLSAVPRAIFAVAAVLSGARGGVNIPDEDKDKVRNVVDRYYAKMRRQFKDETIVSPWDTAHNHSYNLYETEDALFILGRDLQEGMTFEAATESFSQIEAMPSIETHTSTDELVSADKALVEAELLFAEMNVESL